MCNIFLAFFITGAILKIRDKENEMNNIHYEVERSGSSFDVYQVQNGESRYMDTVDALDEQDAINTVLLNSLDFDC